MNPSAPPSQHKNLFTEELLPPQVFAILNDGILLSHFVNNKFSNKFSDKISIKHINSNPIWDFYKEHTDNPQNAPYLTKLYNAYYNYLAFVNDPHNSKDDIYLTGLLEYHISNNLKKQTTIIIFEIINDHIKIKNPLKGTNININPNYVFIIKYKSIYEPILYKSKKTKTLTYVFNKDSPDKPIKITVNDINNIISGSIKNKDPDKSHNSKLDFHNVIKLLLSIGKKVHNGKLEDYQAEYGYINFNNIMTHLICKNGLMLPINPPSSNQYQNKYPIKPIFSINKLEPLPYSFYHQYINIPELSGTFNIDSICVKDKKIIQVIVNKSYVPLMPMPHLKKSPSCNKMIYNNKNLFEIDNIISQNTISQQSNIIEDVYTKDFKINSSVYNEYVIMFINTINSEDPKYNDTISSIIYNNIMIYNHKIRKIYPMVEDFNKSQTIITKFIKSLPRKVDFNNILYKFTYNLVNHGLDISKLLNIKPAEYSDIVKFIRDDELYFTLDNMQHVLDSTFKSNPYSIDNITGKYKHIRHRIVPVEMFRENIHYFNKLLTGNYHISNYRDSNLILLELFSNPENARVFNDVINTMYIKGEMVVSSIRIRFHLADMLVEKYKEDKSTYDILKSYFSSYNIIVRNKDLRGDNISKNIKILKDHIKKDYNITIYDLRSISILYGVNIIIFTLQNENTVDFLKRNHEHNNNPKISIRKIFENKDYKNAKYILLNHRFVDIANIDPINNFSVISIEDIELIEYKNVPKNLRAELQI
jgi:hypothetical protein